MMAWHMLCAFKPACCSKEHTSKAQLVVCANAMLHRNIHVKIGSEGMAFVDQVCDSNLLQWSDLPVSAVISVVN